MKDYDKEIQKFREEWKTASEDRSETIVLQVRALKIAKEKAEKRKGYK